MFLKSSYIIFPLDYSLVLVCGCQMVSKGYVWGKRTNPTSKCSRKGVKTIQVWRALKKHFFNTFDLLDTIEAQVMIPCREMQRV